MTRPAPSPPSRSRSIRWGVLALAGAAAAASVLVGDWIARRLASPELDAAAPPIAPDGFWTHSRLTGGAPLDDQESGRGKGEERARLLSLPYLAGRQAATADAARGVVRHLPERAWAGLNLYTSGHGPEAILTDMEGRVRHRWRFPFERAFPRSRPTPDTAFFRRAHLFPDGRLLALYQTGGLVFLDPGSRPSGTCRGNYYNDLWVEEGADGEGRIWTLAKELRTAGGDPRLDDFLVLLRYRDRGADCREVRRISIRRALERSPYRDLLEPMARRGDVLHANTVTELGPPATDAPGLPAAFAPGRLLVSLREIDLVAVVDPATETALWAHRGPWRAQHEPVLLETGRLLIFDNRGADGLARVLEHDPRSARTAWSWRGEPADPLASAIGGAIARLPNGNTLITLSVPGRALEIDPAGEVVWELRTPHRAGEADELVAMLFEVQRLPAEAIEGWRK